MKSATQSHWEQSGETPRRTTSLDVRRGVRPVHAERQEWITACSTSPLLLLLSAIDLTTCDRMRAVSASL